MLKVMQKKKMKFMETFKWLHRFTNLFVLLLRCKDKLKECLWLLIFNQTFLKDLSMFNSNADL